MIEFVKKWVWQILAIVFFLLFMGKGCTNTKVNTINKNVDQLELRIDSVVNKTFSKKELKDEMERVMLDFLIYEDDLDKGRTSLSTIKGKIESND